MESSISESSASEAMDSSDGFESTETSSTEGFASEVSIASETSSSSRYSPAFIDLSEFLSDSSTPSSSSDSSWDDLMESSLAYRILFPRQIWVDPFFLDKERNGEYNNCCLDLKNYPEKFYSYYRMTLGTYKYILNDIAPSLTKHSPFRDCISPGEKLSVTLRYLTTGMSLRGLELAFRISHVTISKIIEEVFDAIWEKFLSRHMPVPGQYELYKIAEEFESLWQFPNCIGALDGKHVRIFAPDNSVSTYHNYKGFFSMVLQAVADARYRFVFVEVGGYGRQSDGGTFEASSLFRIIEDGTLAIPPPKSLKYCPDIAIPFVFVVDDAYPTTSYLIKPYKFKIDDYKQIFNGRLSRARRCVECAFGVLAAKFRIFYTAIDLGKNKIEKLVKCACLIHNIIIDMEGSKAEETKNRWPVKSSEYQDSEEEDSEDEEYEEIAINGGLKIRETLKDYFVGRGSVPWQTKYIKKFR